ncbi:MAG: hypothetical protein COA99_08005 [Moraxellaceae bacterium]|nr:MAG: hypothetical protein COA99_08005 [Moraxellaceae bacterium]
MDLFIYAEAEDLHDIAESLTASISAWIGKDNEKMSLVNQPDKGWLGIDVTITAQHQLKKPLNFLYGVAKEHKCNFVIGILTSDAREDVCYFGHEEGRPDMYEIATYLEL